MNETVNKTKKKKIVIKDKNKFIKAIAVFVIIIIFVVIIIASAGGKKIDDSTNISELKTKKYAKQIKEYYESQGKIYEFINDYNNIQNQAWMYIYNNLVEDKTQEMLIQEVNEILVSNDWSKINMEKNTKWKGIYRIDTESNSMVFKFESSEIEPDWIDDNSVSYMIEKN